MQRQMFEQFYVPKQIQCLQRFDFIWFFFLGFLNYFSFESDLKAHGAGVIYYFLYHCFIDVHTHVTIIKYLLSLIYY